MKARRWVGLGGMGLGMGLAVAGALYGCASDSGKTTDGGVEGGATTDHSNAQDGAKPPIDSSTMPDTSTGAIQARATIAATVADGGAAGTATFDESGGMVMVTVELTSAPAGLHGMHVHQVGDCGDAGNNAGAHFDPLGTNHHGYPDAGMHHGGDLGNIVVGDGGTGSLMIHSMDLTVSAGDASVVNRAIVIHANVDDGTSTDAGNGGTGNSGGRIGCGVIQRVQ